MLPFVLATNGSNFFSTNILYEYFLLGRSSTDFIGFSCLLRVKFRQRRNLINLISGLENPSFTQCCQPQFTAKKLATDLRREWFSLHISNSKQAKFSDSFTSEKPFYFSAALPEGNYRVTITFGATSMATDTTVKAELRRLMLEKITTAKGKFITQSFIVNVRTPKFPGGEVKLKDREKTSEQWAWDEKLTLEFNGAHPAICAIEITPVNVPTIFLLGDSTITDQSRERNSWGQMLPRFFKPEIAIANHAESGESVKSSLGAKRFEKVFSLMKSGDYLFLQFGHNDQKEKGEGVGAFTSYKSDLKKIVNEVRQARRDSGVSDFDESPHI